MIILRRFIWVLFVFLFFLFPFSAHANHIPSPSGFVNDFANVLTSDQKANLENSLELYEQNTSNEISVVTVKSLEGNDITDFTVKVFEEWKIGKKNKDNGILFLAAIDDRKMRIEVGYGLEPYLTDSEAGDIIRNTIAPHFKNSDYYGGITDGVLAIENQLSGNAQSQSFSSPKSFVNEIKDKFELIFGILLILWVFGSFIVYISSFFARSKSIWAGGMVGGFFGVFIGIFAASLALGILSTLILGGLGLLLDWVLSNKYLELKKAGKKTDWWTTGGGFFRGGSGGGFGGFGGGGSGGGGASGGW